MNKKQYTLYASDPTASDFALVDEDGTKIEGVYSFSLMGSAHTPMMLSIEIVPKGVSVKAGINEVSFACPCCGLETTHQCSG